MCNVTMVAAVVFLMCATVRLRCRVAAMVMRSVAVAMVMSVAVLVCAAVVILRDVQGHAGVRVKGARLHFKRHHGSLGAIASAWHGASRVGALQQRRITGRNCAWDDGGVLRSLNTPHLRSLVPLSTTTRREPRSIKIACQKRR
jgi:hypothetical protein